MFLYSVILPILGHFEMCGRILIQNRKANVITKPLMLTNVKAATSFLYAIQIMNNVNINKVMKFNMFILKTYIKTH